MPADGSGRSCWPVWERTYDLSALNRSHVAGVPCTQADIADLDGIVPAFEEIDTVLHLAASTMAGNWESLLATNIVGVRNVYEAARIQGVKRVVNISSGATILGYGLESPYKDLLAGEYEKLPGQWPLVNERWPIRPDSVYGASKAWGEALGRYYSDYHGLSVICVRLGAFLRRRHARQLLAPSQGTQAGKTPCVCSACASTRPTTSDSTCSSWFRTTATAGGTTRTPKRS